jgi:hypothetical protein
VGSSTSGSGSIAKEAKALAVAWASVRECPPSRWSPTGHDAYVRRHDRREVDLETEAGPLRVALWRDKWVLAWRRDGSDAVEEVFDVFARQAEDLVLPLVRIGMTEQPAQALAAELIAERAVMDEEDERG